MADINIGGKISEHRKAKNLSSRELASLAEITPSLLSQIERGLANPSLNTIKSIAKALEVPLFNFFTASINTKELVVRSDKRKKMVLPENESVLYELLSPDLNGAIEFVFMKLAPNYYSSVKAMEHAGEEAALVLSGKAKLHLDDKIILLSAGDSVRIPNGVKHKWENPYNEDANVIFAITPPNF